MLLPAVATVALGTALLVPLRDDRQGRRATFARGKTPFRPEFDMDGAPASGSALTPGQEQSSTARQRNDSEALFERQPLTTASAPFSFESGSLAVEKNPPPVESVPPPMAVGPLSPGPLHPGARQHGDQSAIECSPAPEGIARPNGRSNGSQECVPEIRPDVLGDVTNQAAATYPALLEPFALVSAVARPLAFLAPPLLFLARPLIVVTRPLIALRDACIRLATFEASAEKQAGETSPTEHSFAAELSALLDQSPPTPSPIPDTPAISAPDDDATLHTYGNTASFGFPKNVAADGSPEVVNPASREGLEPASANEAPPAASTEDNLPSAKTHALPSTDAGPSASAEAVEAAAHAGFLLVARAVRIDRVVPLTRLPLRPQGIEITWTDKVAAFAGSGVPSRTERQAFLERALRDSALLSGSMIGLVYHQEDGVRRTLALRVMLRHFPEAGREIFIEALRVGSDEERAIAIDGLATLGARDELARGVADRVDAIAAKAALAYVGTLDRADYRAELSALIDATKVETILKLLAGIVE